MMNIPNVSFSHTAVPSFTAAPCNRGPLKRVSSPAIKKEEIKNKRREWMNTSEEGKRTKGHKLFLFPVFHCCKHSNNLKGRAYEFKLFWPQKLRQCWGGSPESPTEARRFIKGNEQCHFPFPSSVTFGSAGLGLISTIWPQLHWPVE